MSSPSERSLKTFPPTTHTVIGMDADGTGRYTRYRGRCSCGWTSKSVGKSSIGAAADQLRDHVSTLRERQRVAAWLRDVARACAAGADADCGVERNILEQVADGIEMGEHHG